MSPVLNLSSFHLLQDVQDADVVDGDERFEVGRDADALQIVSCGVEGLQGFSSLHTPPLLKRKEQQQIINHKHTPRWWRRGRHTERLGYHRGQTRVQTGVMPFTHTHGAAERADQEQASRSSPQ